MRAMLLSIAVACLVLIPFGSAPRAGWIENGVLMSDESGNQRYPAIIPDSTGGCYVAWADSRFGSSRIFVQRLDRNGNELWTPGGVQACLYVST